jgi:hypothetical protein
MFLLICIILVILLLFINFLYYNNNTIQEGFYDVSTQTGNPLISRVNPSITANPALPTTSNILLNTTGNGWNPYPPKTSTTSTKSPTEKLPQDCNLVVKLSQLNLINSIQITGIKAFYLFYSRTNDDTFSYQEILYQKLNSSTNTDSSMLFELSDTDADKITTFTNLTTTDGKPVYASYIKIVPVNLSDVEYSSFGSSGNRTGRTFVEKGMKLEIFGYPNDAKPDFSGVSLRSSAKNISSGDEKPELKWTYTKSSPQLKIKFDNNKAKQINSIVFKNNTTNKINIYTNQFTFGYKLNDSNISQNIYNINGSTQANDSTEWKYYFNTPIVASEFTITPTGNINNTTGITIVDIIGQDISDKQAKAVAENSKRQFCQANDANTDTSGSASTLLNQQMEIQQLCDTMELQDQIKENNLKIQKNRQYLMQLDEQDKKIAALEEIVNKMKHLRLIREKNNDHKMLDQQEKQTKVEAQLKQLLADRQANMKQINVNLSLNQNKPTQPASQSQQQTEGFANFIPNTTITSTPNVSRNGVEYSQGFYYRPYADPTVQNQIQENSLPLTVNLRTVANYSEVNFETNPEMRFYENQIYNTHCDNINTNFVKMQSM